MIDPLTNPQVGASILFYAVLFFLLGMFAHGLALGRVRGNAVRVSGRQFPQLQRIAAGHARRLGLKRVPEVYVMESGRLLNAFATRFLGRDFRYPVCRRARAGAGEGWVAALLKAGVARLPTS